MTRIQWGEVDPTYEFGVDHGVLYPTRTSKLSWSGLISVNESPKIDGDNSVYFEGVKIIDPTKGGEFLGSVSAFTYPEELDELQDIYAMSFRTLKEKERTSLHIIYNPTLIPNSVDYQSFGSGIDPVKFSWEISNKPSYLKNFAPSGHFIIDFYNVPETFIDDIEDILYETSSMFPTPQELIDIFEELHIYRTLLIFDHGNGLWTAIGPDDMITYINPTTFQIDSPTGIYLDAETYTISSF